MDNEVECLFSHLAGTQEDPGGHGHGPGLPPVPGPAGLHARAHLPWWERPGLLPGTPGGGPAQHDQWVSVAVVKVLCSVLTQSYGVWVCGEPCSELS